ncbi:MAG: protein kinase [Blastocatellia bacterium]|nr:protein kinase [Blastocatellia bacterium]
MADHRFEDQLLRKAVERGWLTDDDLSETATLVETNAQLMETVVDLQPETHTLSPTALLQTAETIVGHQQPSGSAIRPDFTACETVIAPAPSPLGNSAGMGPRIEFLIQKGKLSQTAAETLCKEIRQTAAPYSATGPQTSPQRKPLHVSQTLSFFVHELREKKAAPGQKGEFPVVEWDRYDFIKLIGEGGMGVVYQARDRRLDRLVALKFIRGGDPTLLERFMQEARSQSRIDHPNVCKVFEVGDVEGMPYIAMQYVDGDSLAKARKWLNLEQQVRIVKEVAEALAAAHRIGIIHRDIKPANILVERAADGQLMPVVMDFGLARDSTHDIGLTQSGMIMGTPAYMSPEQAAGDINHLDRRADVYSLGAMLFDLLAGRPPFEAVTPMQVVLKVLHDDPPSLERLDPKIPRDLATIAMKCLEKDPSQRYESAQALARDLQAYLDGDPISARQATMSDRLRRKVKKHRTLLAISTLALLAIGFLGVETLQTRWRAQEGTRYALEFGDQAFKIEADLRPAYMLPLHDIRPERASAQWQLNHISLRMAQGGQTAQGPGNYALGQGYLALYNFRKAKTHLDQAIRLGFQTPEVDFALGRVLGELFQEEVGEVERLGNREAREFRRRELETLYLQTALKHLELYVKSNTSGTESRETLYLEGLIAFYRKDFPKAIGKAQDTIKLAPWMYEAHLLSGDALIGQALAARDNNDFELAVTRYQEAEAEYLAAMKIAPSAEVVYLRQASCGVDVLLMEVARGKPVEAAAQKAIEACDKALQTNSESGVAWCLKARSLFRRGEYQNGLGQDPRSNLNEAIQCARQAIRFESGNATAHTALGNAYHQLGKYESSHGVDPLASFNRAAEAFRQAISVANLPGVPLNSLGNVMRDRAQYEMWHGIDPTVALGKALECYDEAIRTSPGYALAYNNLGTAYENKGSYQLRLGQNPTEAFDRAIENFKHSIELNPQSQVAYGNLGHVFLNLAAYRLEMNQNPANDLTQAQTNFSQSLHLRPDAPWVLLEQAKAEILAARFAIIHHTDPQNAFATAGELLEKAWQAKADGGSAALVEAELVRRKAEWLKDTGQNPALEIQKGLELTQKALTINPDATEATALQGALLLLQAQSLTNQTAQTQIAIRARNILEKVLTSGLLFKREYEPLYLIAKQLAERK